MSELQQWIDQQLTERFHQRVVELGYWCPRCDCEALPLHDGEPGWCPICGLNPRTPGIAPTPAEPKGISA